VLLDAGDDDFVAAPVPSRPPRCAFDLSIELWREAGLNVASTIRVHKLNVLAKSEIPRQLGELAAADKAALAQVV
jgi:mRNA-degrading endonuclease toxin of MazEF toxin-antitoxin module